MMLAMRSSSACILVALFALGAAAASAQSAQSGVTVDYLDGAASQRVKSSWVALAIGVTLPADASVKLEDHSLLQLKAAGATITLVQPGTYALKELVASRASLRAAGAGTAVAAAFAKILSGTGKERDAAGGARADIAEPSDEQKWEAAHSQGPMEAGKELLAQGKYPEAVQQFFQATTVSEGSDADDAQFYLASAYALNGDVREALVSIAAISSAGEADWADDALLLKAKLLEDTFSFSAAIDLLLTHGAKLAVDPTRAPTWLFLLAVGYKGRGDLARERACLEKVRSLDPESVLAASAALLLKNL